MEEQGAAQKCPRAGGLELQGRGHVLGQNVTFVYKAAYLEWG